MNPIEVALKGKGLSNLLRRVHSIFENYGLSPKKLDQALELLADILRRFECRASFPTVALVLARTVIVPKVARVGKVAGIEQGSHVDRRVDQVVQLRSAADLQAVVCVDKVVCKQ